jgi:hypothetical protein
MSSLKMGFSHIVGFLDFFSIQVIAENALKPQFVCILLNPPTKLESQRVIIGLGCHHSFTWYGGTHRGNPYLHICIVLTLGYYCSLNIRFSITQAGDP